MIAVKNDTQPQWQLQTAKAQFSQVVKRAVDSGPQLVSICLRTVSAKTICSPGTLNCV